MDSWLVTNKPKCIHSLHAFLKKHDGDIVIASIRPSVFPSVCPSRILLQKYWVEFYQTSFITSLHCKVAESNIIFFRVSVRACVRRPSICPSRYLLLNHWANSTKLATSLPPHGKAVREQHYFSVRPSSFHLCIMLISTLTTGRNSTKLATSLPIMVRVCETLFFLPASIHLSVTPSPPKPLGGTTKRVTWPPITLRVWESVCPSVMLVATLATNMGICGGAPSTAHSSLFLLLSDITIRRAEARGHR